jgi:hypothetical protein
MDPVNKWLTTVILFMAGMLFVMWHVGGAGRYEIAVEKSALFKEHAVVYVLDTKDGQVKAQLFDENDLHYNNTIKNSPQLVLEYEASGYRGRY